MITPTRPSLHDTATRLHHQGYTDLADLLHTIATARTAYHQQPVASLPEATRWGPVVTAALRFAEGLTE